MKRLLKIPHRNHSAPVKTAVVICVLVLNSFAQAESPENPYDELVLELLFEVNLKAEGPVKPYVKSEEPFSGFSMSRDLIAQGEGFVRGNLLKGTVTWSLLAIRVQDAALLNTHVSGWITTEDGAEIFFNGMGNAALSDPAQPTRWMYTSTVVFEDADQPYEWLTTISALWVGEFNVKTGTARYRAYIPTDFLKSRGE